LIDRSMRRAYQQERTIEAQRVAIERERARAVQLQAEASARELALLNAEVRRQVAERSRDLAQALSRLSDAPRAPSVLAAGQVVEGRYRVVRLIGAGGMGQVHEVERLVDGRRFALKMISGVPHREALMRLAREAEIAAQLDHPNVVAALDVGITALGAVFLVMQLVPGPTLQEQAGRFGDVAWAIPILAQIARALAVMHAHGIIHRDLKPSNVLLDGTTVKVTDFGIASLARGLGTEPLTRTGVIIGTPIYMAPELADGVREATPASDLFSLGVLAYEILANRLPHALPPALERLHGRVPKPALALGQISRTVPDEVAQFVDRCLTYGPDDRPSALVAADLFGRLSAG
jgi:serine/threonine protein kinase